MLERYLGGTLIAFIKKIRRGLAEARLARLQSERAIMSRVENPSANVREYQVYADLWTSLKESGIRRREIENHLLHVFWGFEKEYSETEPVFDGSYRILGYRAKTLVRSDLEMHMKFLEYELELKKTDTIYKIVPELQECVMFAISESQGVIPSLAKTSS